MEVVLEHDGQPEDRGPLPGAQTGVGGAGQGQAPGLILGEQGVEVSVQVPDPVEGGADQGLGGQVAGIQALAPVHRRAQPHARSSGTFYFAITRGSLPALATGVETASPRRNPASTIALDLHSDRK